MAAVWPGIEVMGCQVEGQILRIHVGVFEGGYRGLQIRYRGIRRADWDKHDRERYETYCA